MYVVVRNGPTKSTTHPTTSSHRGSIRNEGCRNWGPHDLGHDHGGSSEARAARPAASGQPGPQRSRLVFERLTDRCQTSRCGDGCRSTNCVVYT